MRLFQSSSLDIVGFLADIGIIFLLLQLGLEADLEKKKASSRDTALIAFFASLVPFLFGFYFLRFLGYSVVASVIFRGTLSVTAEGITVKVLMDAGALNTKIGALIVSAGTIDNLFEVIFLSARVCGLLFTDTIIRLIILSLFYTGGFVAYFIETKRLYRLISSGIKTYAIMRAQQRENLFMNKI